LCAYDIILPLHVEMRERNVVEEFDTDVETLAYSSQRLAAVSCAAGIGVQ